MTSNSINKGWAIWEVGLCETLLVLCETFLGLCETSLRLRETHLGLCETHLGYCSLQWGCLKTLLAAVYKLGSL